MVFTGFPEGLVRFKVWENFDDTVPQCDHKCLFSQTPAPTDSDGPVQRFFSVIYLFPVIVG